MKRRRVTVLCHEDLIPPLSDEGYDDQEYQRWKTEFDVADTLRWLGHDVNVLGVSDDLRPIRRNLEEVKPHVVFNLLMEFRDVGSYQPNIVSYLELLGARFTGCNSRGILLTRDKALCKKILRYHRISTPHFIVFPRDRNVRVPRSTRFPLIVKSVDEEASFGIAQASVVADEARLRDRVDFVHRHVGTDAIAEEYIEGRELTLSILGNERLTTFPVWELFFERLPEGALPIATARVKFDLDYQQKRGITIGRAKGLPADLERQITRMGKRIYRILGLSGYARLDLRLAPDGRVYVIEVNSTPDVAENEDFAVAAEAAGIEYPTLIQRIVNLGIAYRSPSTG